MSSTEFNIGLSSAKSSSRVLKPPGGGHSDIFGSPEKSVNNPRPKYDQQNSSNLNFCMNTTDPNISVQKTKEEVVTMQQQQNVRSDAPPKQLNNITGPAQPDHPAQNKGRVPPGGFSSGLW